MKYGEEPVDVVEKNEKDNGEGVEAATELVSVIEVADINDEAVEKIVLEEDKTVLIGEVEKVPVGVLTEDDMNEFSFAIVGEDIENSGIVVDESGSFVEYNGSEAEETLSLDEYEEGSRVEDEGTADDREETETDGEASDEDGEALLAVRVEDDLLDTTEIDIIDVGSVDAEFG